MTISSAIARMQAGMSRGAHLGMHGTVSERSPADKPASQDIARVSGLSGVSGLSSRAIGRVGQLLRSVSIGLAAPGCLHPGASCGIGNVGWAASRLLSHLSGKSPAQCATWRRDLQLRERELDLACQKEVARWQQLNRDIELACRKERIDRLGFHCSLQTDSSLGHSTRIDDWLIELEQLVKARHLSHRRLSFLQQEHENIHRTLAAFGASPTR